MLQAATVEKVEKRTIELEFLYLDLNTCTRCVGTNENLESALQSVADVLALTNTAVIVRKVLIENEEQALAHQFVTSPTIRVNGRDIALSMRESQCDSCTDLCGCAEGTDCREWEYQGEVFMEAPVGLIVEAVLAEIYGGGAANTAVATASTVPDNLKNFFAGQAQVAAVTANSCCSETKQETCCEPSAKADCCGTTSEGGSCGCQ